ncbi:MAG: transposase [Candidatus Enterosoma sp.]|nr:transposase [Candidatus Enterosoma sp.]
MKYSWEEKIRAVEHYLSDGSIDYPESCLTPSQAKTYANHVRFWKAQYLLKGKEGLRHKEFNRTYSPEAKYRIIKPILDGTVSCTEQACRTGIGSGQLFFWVKRYRERGWEGLKCSKPGRPGKNMKQEKEEKEPRTAPEDGTKKSYEELEHENLLLKFEVEYLKKLKALAERETGGEDGSRRRDPPRRKVRKQDKAGRGPRAGRAEQVDLRIRQKTAWKEGRPR